MNQKEIAILKELGKRVAEIAALPVQEETIRCWKALNRLQPERPMVVLDQLPWHEMNVEGELTLQCEEPFARELEWKLRETLYRWKHIRADMVVEKFVAVSKVIRSTGFGVTSVEDTVVSDENNDVVGHSYHDQLLTEEDLEKIKTPQISLDVKETQRREEDAKEVFSGILGVSMTGMDWSRAFFAPWDRIVEWHGVESSLIDLVDRPDFIHNLMERLTNAYLGMLDQLEQQGLLYYDMPSIHCSGAYTDELPAPGFQPEKPRAKDLWTCGMAQIFATVSPAMHEEFDLQYARKWYERFGMVYYGCCEPLHDKIDILRTIPNLRKISISPWANVQKASERIDKDFVISRKTMPAFLAEDGWNTDIICKEMEQTRDACRKTGTPLEFILKDVSTIRYQPQRLKEWVEQAMRIVNE